MTVSTRRRFVQQAGLAAAAVFARSGRSQADAAPAVPGKQSPIVDPAAVRALAAKTNGRVLTPGDPEYEAARLVFNRAFDRHPALLVRCAGAPDVARALEFAQVQNLPVAVRGGGHSRLGFGVCDNGVVIDLSAMNGVAVEERRRVARADAGALVHDMDHATQRLGLATTMGGCSSVGIAGFTLGGGEGLLMSKHGAGCDNLLSARVVTVDGRQIVASPESNPDLFWALRGGGGNFAVVTALEYQLHPVGDVLAGILKCPAGGIPDRLQAFARFNVAAPDEVNTVGMVLPSEQGTRFQMMVFSCGDPGHGDSLLGPLRQALKPQDDQVRVKPYLEAQVAGFLSTPVAHFQTDLFLPELSDGAVSAITAATSNAPPLSGVFIVPFTGAITRVAATDTAFSLRRYGYEVDIVCRWKTPAEKASAVQWVMDLRDRLHPFAHGLYVNQTCETGDELVKTAYGINYARLVEIKKKYDPRNVLRLNQNIKPG